MRRAYLAHPLGSGPGREFNRRNAGRWGALLGKTLRIAISADWIWVSEALPETPENRAHGIACDLVHVASCPEILLVGGRISEGMSLEVDQAVYNGARVVDLTWLGFECPPSLSPEVVEQIQRLRGVA